MISWTPFENFSFKYKSQLVVLRLLECALLLIPGVFLVKRSWTNSLLNLWIPLLYLLYCMLRRKYPLQLLWRGPALWCLVLIWLPSILTLGFSEAWQEGRFYLWGIVTMSAAYQVQLDHKVFIHYVSMFMVLLGGLCGLDALLQAFLKMDLLGNAVMSQRSVAFFSNPNYLAFFLAGIFPISLYRVLNSKQLWQSIISITLSYFVFAGLVLTGTRSAWIAAIIAFITIMPIFLKNTTKSFWIKITVSLIGAVVLAYLTASSMLTQRIFYFSSYGEPRLKLWKEAIEIIIMAPCCGLGIGNWVLDLNGVPTFAHNFFLEVAMECGIPAFIFFLYMCGCVATHLYSTLHRDGAGRFFTAAVLAFFVASAITIPFFSRYTVTVLFPFLGLVLGYCETIQVQEISLQSRLSCCSKSYEI